MQVNAANCVVGMLDYNTASLCLAHNTIYAYVKQGHSSDEPFICHLLERHGLGLEMSAEVYASGDWDEVLDKVEGLLSGRCTYRCQSTAVHAVNMFAVAPCWSPVGGGVGGGGGDGGVDGGGGGGGA